MFLLCETLMRYHCKGVRNVGIFFLVYFLLYFLNLNAPLSGRFFGSCGQTGETGSHQNSQTIHQSNTTTYSVLCLVYVILGAIIGNIV